MDAPSLLERYFTILFVPVIGLAILLYHLSPLHSTRGGQCGGHVRLVPDNPTQPYRGTNKRLTILFRSSVWHTPLTEVRM